MCIGFENPLPPPFLVGDQREGGLWPLVPPPPHLSYASAWGDSILKQIQRIYMYATELNFMNRIPYTYKYSVLPSQIFYIFFYLIVNFLINLI